MSAIAVTAADQPVPHDHLHRRVFVGPLPEKAISQAEAHSKKNKKPAPASVSAAAENLEDEDDIPDIIKKNAFQFFIRRGGRAEDWGEHEERSVREEMVRRWKESEWATVWSHHRKRGQKGAALANGSDAGRRWVGGSFEIGQFLGTNVLEDVVIQESPQGSTDDLTSGVGVSGNGDGHRKDTARPSPPPRRSGSVHRSVSGSRPATHGVLPAVGTASAVRERLSDRSLNVPAEGPSRLWPDSDAYDSASDWNSHRDIMASSTTSLLKTHAERARPDRRSPARAQTLPVPRPVIKQPRRHQTNGDAAVDRKGKGKVHYADPATNKPPELAPLSENMEGPSQMPETSLASASTFPESIVSASNEETGPGDIIMKDRVFVRFCCTKANGVGPHFNEEIHRTTRDLESAEWAEYVVALRKDRVELYQDHRLPLKEWFTKQKQLAHTIPLKAPATQLSLYSFVDLTFCLTCPAAKRASPSKARLFLLGEDEGTHIFIFKVKCRSRAYDWLWRLWRQLGGQLPSSINVRNPRLDMKVKVDVPNEDEDEIFKVFDRENAIALCMNTLRTVPNWNSLIERDIKEGKSLELAWRVETHLDWIWLEEDDQGFQRPWDVLAGLALKQSSKTPAILEIRVAEHSPSYIHLPNGNRLHEPPAIEGFLDRIKPNSQAKQSIYVSTHDGNLFVIAAQDASPPSPPGFAPCTDDLEKYAENLRKTEVERGIKQIMRAHGVADLRKILVVRRAIHPIYQPKHNEPRKKDNDMWFDIWSQSEPKTMDDEEDIGGEEGLAKAQDKPQLRMRRSFELLLITGNVVRFEAYSCRVAIEWIERLRALVLYWREKHRVAAKEEMDVAQARRPRLTPLTRVIDDCDHPPEPPPDTSAPLPALGSLYNWCILEECKSIIKGGKVFMRKGLYGQYKMVQLFLVDGHLVRFRISPKSSLHISMHKKTSLVDAYVCSGYLAALTLPEGQYVATAKSAPRRYQDGLETDDREEDTLFMVWYQHPTAHQGPPPPVPNLSSKKKVLVCRARSRLERDAWCYALGCEVEKLARAQKEREEKLRDIGIQSN